jgi:sterol desaturase/sphingolipid hydroxylase (fatty acid hydroxylase superfamily)
MLGKLFMAGWIIALLLAERLYPATTRQPGDLRRVIRNGLMGVGVVAMGPLVLMIHRTWFGITPPLVPLAHIGPDWLVLPIQFLIFDAWVYATHRAYHRIPIMWRLHAPHHLDEHLDVTSAFRFHPGEILLSALLRAVPCLAVGISPAHLLLFESVLTANAVFHHSNLRLPGWLERPLSRLIVTPSIHWVHHHAVRADTDSNYAALLSVWDRLFGTRSVTRRWGDMPIGVEGVAERDIGSLLAWPFRKLT